MSFRPIASPKLHPHSSPERGSGSSLGSFVDIQKVTAVYGDATSAGGKQPSGRRVLYDDETTVSVVIPVAPNLVMDQTSDDENSGNNLYLFEIMFMKISSALLLIYLQVISVTIEETR